MAARSKLAISEQRVRGKLLECVFFLEHMKQSGSPEEFGYYLSAFLAALATFTDLALIRKHGKNSNQVLQQVRRSAADLDFLLDARDVEVHREGVRIWLYRDSHRSRYGTGLWSALAATSLKGSKIPRYTSRFLAGVMKNEPEGRIIVRLLYRLNYPRGPVPLNNVFTCCRRALTTVRRIDRGWEQP